MALSEALKPLLDEGLEQRFRRHHILAEALRTAMDALNIRFVTHRSCVADTVTALYYPEKIEDSAFRSDMKRRGIVVASNIGPSKRERLELAILEM